MQKDEESSNWAELPSELMVSIFLRFSVFERKIDSRIYNQDYDLDSMCRHAVDRSEDGLVHINMQLFADQVI